MQRDQLHETDGYCLLRLTPQEKEALEHDAHREQRKWHAVRREALMQVLESDDSDDSLNAANSDISVELSKHREISQLWRRFGPKKNSNERKWIYVNGEGRCYLAYQGVCKGDPGDKFRISLKDAQIEHRSPKSRYPERMFDMDNWSLACRSCNSSKGPCTNASAKRSRQLQKSLHVRVSHPELLAALSSWPYDARCELAAAIDVDGALCDLNSLMEELVEFVLQRDGSLRMLDVFAKFAKKARTKAQRKREIQQFAEIGLPIYSKKAAIVSQMRKCACLVITAETGAGKTTQVPQYFVDHVDQSGNRVAVLVPTRTIARKVAQKVASERGGTVGGEVGYALGGGEVCGGRRITFMTYGYFVHGAYRNDSELSRYSAVFVDEAHTRSVDCDIVLTIARDVQQWRRHARLQLVCMSATINPRVFQSHWNNCPALHVRGRTFPVESVQDYAQCDTIHLEEMVKHAVAAATAIHQSSSDLGHILCFMPGKREIEDAVEMCRIRVGDSAVVLPMYSALTRSEQERVLRFEESERRGIFFATNVCEAGATIPGLQHVVDTGLERQAGYDPGCQETTLTVGYISRSQAEQRKGRAGRTADGFYYPLYASSVSMAMDEYPAPECYRVSLEEVVLKLASVGLNARTFDFITPLDQHALKDAYTNLDDLGALVGEKVTVVGETMAVLCQFLRPRAARFAIAANDLGCGQQGLVVALALESTSPTGAGPFLKHRRPPFVDEYDRTLSRFAHSSGDHMTLLSLYECGAAEPVVNSDTCRAIAKQLREITEHMASRSAWTLTSFDGDCHESIGKALCSSYFTNLAMPRSLISLRDGVTLFADGRPVSHSHVHPGSAVLSAPGGRDASFVPRHCADVLIYHRIQEAEDDSRRVKVVSVVPHASWLQEMAPRWCQRTRFLKHRAGLTLANSWFPFPAFVRSAEVELVTPLREQLRDKAIIKLMRAERGDPKQLGLYVCTLHSTHVSVLKRVVQAFDRCVPAVYHLEGGLQGWNPSKIGLFVSLLPQPRSQQGNMIDLTGVDINLSRDATPDSIIKVSCHGDAKRPDSFAEDMRSFSTRTSVKTKAVKTPSFACLAVLDYIWRLHPLIVAVCFDMAALETRSFNKLYRIALQEAQLPQGCTLRYFQDQSGLQAYLNKSVLQAAHIPAAPDGGLLLELKQESKPTSSHAANRHIAQLIDIVVPAAVILTFNCNDGGLLRQFVGKAGASIQQFEAELKASFGQCLCLHVPSASCQKVMVFAAGSCASSIDDIAEVVCDRVCGFWPLKFQVTGVPLGLFIGKGGANVKQLQAQMTEGVRISTLDGCIYVEGRRAAIHETQSCHQIVVDACRNLLWSQHERRMCRSGSDCSRSDCTFNHPWSPVPEVEWADVSCPFVQPCRERWQMPTRLAHVSPVDSPKITIKREVLSRITEIEGFHTAQATQSQQRPRYDTGPSFASGTARGE